MDGGPCSGNRDPNFGKGGQNNDCWGEACVNPCDCFSNF